VKKSRKVTYVGHEMYMEKTSYKQKLQSEISKERNHLKEIGLDKGIILKCLLRNRDVKASTPNN
jgi:hypothetical protein